MKTEDLIQRLGAEAQPVRPLATPWQRTSLWLAVAIGYVLLVSVGSWLRHGALLGITADPTYAIQQLALVVLAIVAGEGAFSSVVPGVSGRRSWTVIIPVTVLMAALLWGMFDDVRTQGSVGLGREVDWPCVGSITVGAAILWASAMALLRRGAALSPATTGLLTGLAAVSLANVEACVTRAHAFTVTVLLWHGVTSMVAIACSISLSRRTLVWPPRRTSSATSH